MRVHEHDAAIAQPQLQLAVVVPKLAGRGQAPIRAAGASQLHHSPLETQRHDGDAQEGREMQTD